jgi:hypothetical protein
MVAGGPNRQDIFVPAERRAQKSMQVKSCIEKLMHVVENVVSCAQSLCTVCNILSNVLQRLLMILAGYCETIDNLRRVESGKKCHFFRKTGFLRVFCKKPGKTGETPVLAKKCQFLPLQAVGDFSGVFGEPQKTPQKNARVLSRNRVIFACGIAYKMFPVPFSFLSPPPQRA